jgi:hypothetical protein
MPRVYELTWDKTLHRWVKVIGGKKYYFSKRVPSKASHEQYLTALSEYRRLLPDILAGKQVGSAASRLPQNSRRNDRNPKKRISYAVSEYHRYLDGRTSEQKTPNSISPGRAIGVKNWLKTFLSFVESSYPSRDITRIDEEVISKYWSSQIGLVGKSISHHTAFQRFAILKNFLKFCWRRRLINELPRNLSDLKVGLPQDKEPEWFDYRATGGREVQRLLDRCKADEFLYLCVLLGLNCGFTMKDIHDLTTADFLWHSKGWKRIARNRSKSGQYGSFILWTETERLLMKHKVKSARYNTRDRLLAMPDGSPVMTTKGGQFDSPIAYRFKKMIRAEFGDEDTRSFKTLRKTGANFCVRRQPGSEIIYLAHKPRTMAARFYAEIPPDTLDRILCYMENDFELSPSVVRRFDEKAY